MKLQLKLKATFCLVIVAGLLFSTTSSFATTNEEIMSNVFEVTEEQMLEKLNSIRGNDEKLVSIPMEPTIVPVEKEMGPLEKYYPSNMSETEIEVVLDRIANGENVIFGDGAVDINAVGMARWGTSNNTHQWIVTRAFTILGNEFPEIRSMFSSSEISTVTEYADWPDNNETTDMNSWHFYHYPTGTNYSHKTDNTAKSRFVFWYESAVRQYRNGKTVQGFQDLGKAIHYLSDIGTPVHTGDRGVKIGNTVGKDLEKAVAHLLYETEAGKIKGNYNVGEHGYYEFYANNTWDEIVNLNARLSYSYYDSDSYGRIQYPLQFIQRDIAGLLYRFYVQTGLLSYH